MIFISVALFPLPVLFLKFNFHPLLPLRSLILKPPRLCLTSRFGPYTSLLIYLYTYQISYFLLTLPRKLEPGIFELPGFLASRITGPFGKYENLLPLRV